MRDTPVRPIRYWDVRRDTAQEVAAYIVAEAGLCVHVNGQEWVRLMCSPHSVEDLVVGFLYLEGVIRTPEDIAVLEVTGNRRCVDVWLRYSVPELPRRATITSGCGGGVTFEREETTFSVGEDPFTLSPDTIAALMQELYQAARAYQQARGIHAAGLSDGERLLFVAEDVGRHNAVDRVCGQALCARALDQCKVLLTTGRISSEMARKAARMQVPVLASRTSPTEFAVRLAERWGMTVIGYVRRHHLRVYSHPRRVMGETDTTP